MRFAIVISAIRIVEVTRLMYNADQQNEQCNYQCQRVHDVTFFIFFFHYSAGHLVNFYHVGTQPIAHLHCMTKEFSFPSDSRPNIDFWFFQTLTGLTGITLFIICCFIFVFAHPKVRKKAYNFFWMTHQLYVLLYVFR